jgi:hypothetical protein
MAITVRGRREADRGSVAIDAIVAPQDAGKQSAAGRLSNTA